VVCVAGGIYDGLAWRLVLLLQLLLLVLLLLLPLGPLPFLVLLLSRWRLTVRVGLGYSVQDCGVGNSKGAVIWGSDGDRD